MSVTAQTVVYLFLIDGCPVAFATDESLALSDLAAWGEWTSVHYGLDLPSGLASVLDLTSGLLSDTSASFTLRDVDDTLADLFASSNDDATELLTEILPGDTAPASTWGKHVGTELIGPAGERRQCSCVPGWNIGMHHFGSGQSYAIGAGETPVSDLPIVWAGRRACLYRLVRTASGGWPDLTDGTARRSALVWFGTFLGQGSPSRHSWPLRFAGPESWAMGNLATGLRKDPVPVRASVNINTANGEHKMRGSLLLINPFDSTSAHNYVAQATDTTSLVGATSFEDVVAAVNAFITDIIDDAGSGTAFSSIGLSTARYEIAPGNEGILILWERESDPNYAGGNYTARLLLRMHEKVWQVLGFEPTVQVGQQLDTEEPFFAWFNVAPEDWPGHYEGRFYAHSKHADEMLVEGDFSEITLTDMSNDQNYRRWAPLCPGGAQVFDTNAVGQELTFRTFEPLYLVPTKATPLMGDPTNATLPYSITNGVGEVTATGLIAVRGPYRTIVQNDDDAITTTQVARICWRTQSDGSVALDDDGFPRAVVYRWENPRVYGIDNEQVGGTWATFVEAPEGQAKTEARQLVAFEHAVGAADSLPYVYARLLCSTGSSGDWWTSQLMAVPQFGIEPNAYLEPGANDLGLDGLGAPLLGRFTDAEAPGLGRGIPTSMIASTSDMVSSVESAIADAATDDLLACKVVVSESASLRKILDGMLRVTGWGMSLAGGRFGLFDMWKWRTSGLLGVVSAETYVSEPGDPIGAVPSQELRELSPVDVVDLQAVRDATANKYARTLSRTATDPGSQYRGQTMRRSIDAPFLAHPSTLGFGSGWATSFAQRWDTGFRWWASQHFKVKFTAPLTRHLEFWPGDIVTLTDEWLVNPAGGYGLASAPGFVISREVNVREETVEVEALVNGSTFRIYAPAAVALEYDDVNYTITCEADWLSCRGGASSDVDGFIEPAWSDEGGDAEIDVLEFNGVSWAPTLSGFVNGIDLTNPSAPKLELTGALTGTWRRDRHHLVVLSYFDDQAAAWVGRVYAPVCDKDGTADGSALGTKFVG